MQGRLRPQHEWHAPDHAWNFEPKYAVAINTKHNVDPYADMQIVVSSCKILTKLSKVSGMRASTSFFFSKTYLSKHNRLVQGRLNSLQKLAILDMYDLTVLGKTVCKVGMTQNLPVPWGVEACVLHENTTNGRS